jgi:hypothetical protein
MKTQLQKLILGLALIIPFALADGAVNLVFNTPTQTVLAGGTFNVTLSLQVTAGEQVTGLDYYFQELSSAGFTITNRDITGSAFSDAYFSNAQLTSSGDAATPAGADNALNTRNDYDLGAVTNPAGTITGSGFVATFTLGVPNTAGIGQQYTISTTSNAGTGWVGPGPSFTDNPFSSQASMVVTVVPEPATWSLLSLGVLASLGLNVLRRKVRR